jgi:hypothetical protein
MNTPSKITIVEDRKRYTTETYKQVTDKFITEIMDQFDFDKVQRVMDFLNWGWASHDFRFELKVPSVARIQSVARELLEMAATKRTSCSTGGLAVIFKEGIEDEIPWVSIGLSFTIEEYDFDGEYYAHTN